MAQIIRSGAFLQQCWSIHPLCVTVKRMTEDRTLLLSCSSCRSVHHLSLSLIVPKEPAAQEQTGGSVSVSGEHGTGQLNGCIATHQSAITLREMDVFQDLVLLRCAECRRHYELTVSSFETHQR
jgi:hypothetical protein